MSKIIGITGYATENFFGASKTHLTFLEQFGRVKIIMPDDDPEVINKEVDMIYLPGGLDVNPVLYGEAPKFSTSNIDVFKNYFLTNKLPQYISLNTPIFGVCLGFQSLAVALGAKLTQNFLFHEQSTSRWQEAHKVYNTLTKDAGGVKVSKKGSTLSFAVNSHHHQGLVYNNVNENIRPVLFAENNDAYLTGDSVIVEAFIAGEKNQISAVQWHPEEFYDEYSVSEIKRLINLK